MWLHAQEHPESKCSIQKDQVLVLCTDVSCLSENDVLSLKHEGEFMNTGRCSEIIWTYLIYSDFIIMCLNSKQLLARHIPYLRLYIAAISLRLYIAAISLHLYIAAISLRLYIAAMSLRLYIAAISLCLYIAAISLCLYIAAISLRLYIAAISLRLYIAAIFLGAF